ncbi:hypothetical protein [Plantactinospora sonchi]|uniref:hypothetical protein n=1 Tax=Plantactinospora sonchi TaxID=1544735 RepID=UPI0038B4D382
MTWAMALSAEEEERLRPLYARLLRLRHVDPGGVLCFVYFEGMVSLGLLLALAELVSWWGVFLLPVSVAAMVKANDLVAAAVARTAARVPAQERERFRRELQPAIGRASVPGPSLMDSGPDPGTDALGGAAASGALAISGLGVPGARAARERAVDVERIAGPSRDCGFAPGVRDVGSRLVARLVPTGRPLSMTSMVRARLELGARPRSEPDWEPRPDRDVMERLRAGVPGLSPLTVAPPTGDRTGPVADRIAPGQAGGEAPMRRDALATWARSAELPSRQTGVSGSGSAGGRPRNDRVVDRSTRRWLVRLDPVDSARQWTRQSARRRYE